MTNSFKAVMGFVLISQAIFLVFAGLYVDQIIEKKTASQEAYYARRDELLSQQQRLESLVTQLNATLNFEQSRQQTLASQLAEITMKQTSAGASQPQPAAAPAAQLAPSTSPPQSQPAPTPPPRVTRAS